MDMSVLGFVINAKFILWMLWMVFVLFVCDLLVCRYYLRVALTKSFIIRSIFANIMCLPTILILEYLIKIGLPAGPRAFHIDVITGIFGTIVKILIYGKLLPRPLFNWRSFFSIFFSTYVGMITGIILMFIGSKLFM